MRKIFTLFAVLMTLVSVAAGPKFVGKANITRMTLNQRHHLTARSGEKLAKVAMAPQKMHGKRIAIGNASKIKNAPTSYELTYSVCNYDGYEADTWFSITTTDEAYKFYFDILVPESELVEGKTYTLADCDPDFSYISDNTTYAMIKLSDLALTLSKGTDGKFLVEATCISKDGDTYHLTYKALERPETFTDVVINDLPIRFYDFTKASGLFQFTGKNDVYDFGICVVSKSAIEGKWETADLNQTYTYLSKDGKNLKLCDESLEVTAIGKKQYHIVAKMYCYDGNVYIVEGDYVEPTVKNTATIVATDLKIDDQMFDIYKGFYGYGVADITASNDDYTITGSILSYTTIAGHYDDYDHMLNELFITNVDGVKTDFFSSNLDVAKANDSWTIKGKVLCWDNTEYTLDLSFSIPDIKGEKTYTSTEGELNDQTAELGAFQIYALDEDYNEFSVALPGEEVVSGHYSQLSEENKTYCYIYSDGKVYQMYSANFDLTADGETFTLTGTCQGGDQLWTVNISGIFLSQEDSFDATWEDGEVDVAFSLEDITEFEINTDEGYAYLEVMNKERNDVWMAIFTLTNNELPAGDYPINLSYAPGTAQPGEIYEGNLYPTTYFHVDSEGYANIPVWYCNEGTIKISYDDQNNIVVDCEAFNTNYVPVHVTVNANPTGIDKLADSKQKKDGKFLENNSIVIRNNGKKFNAVGQEIK